MVYDIYLNGTEIKTDTESLPYNLENLETNTQYTVKGTAKSKGNQSFSETTVFKTLEIVAVPKPFTINGKRTAVFSTFIKWPESSDSEGYSIVYDVYLDYVFVKGYLLSKFYPFEDLKPETTYTSKVVAKTKKGGFTIATQKFTTTEAGQLLPDFSLGF